MPGKLNNARLSQIFTSYFLKCDFEFRAENIDLISGQSVKKISIINRNADVEALRKKNIFHNKPTNIFTNIQNNSSQKFHH